MRQVDFCKVGVRLIIVVVSAIDILVIWNGIGHVGIRRFGSVLFDGSEASLFMIDCVLLLTLANDTLFLQRTC